MSFDFWYSIAASFPIHPQKIIVWWVRRMSWYKKLNALLQLVWKINTGLHSLLPNTVDTWHGTTRLPISSNPFTYLLCSTSAWESLLNFGWFSYIALLWLTILNYVSKYIPAERRTNLESFFSKYTNEPSRTQKYRPWVSIAFQYYCVQITPFHNASARIPIFAGFRQWI